MKVMKNIVVLGIVIALFSCKKLNQSPYPCLDGTCETQFWIDTSYGIKASYSNGYYRIKVNSGRYFTIRGKLAEVIPNYVVNGVPLVATEYDSDYWMVFDTLRFTTPMYAVYGWYSNSGMSSPIPVGNKTYTIKSLVEVTDLTNLAGYTINKKTCMDCVYSKTLFGTCSKYNYNPKHHFILLNQMKGDTATLFIKATYNADIGDSIVKESNFKIIFE